MGTNIQVNDWTFLELHITVFFGSGNLFFRRLTSQPHFNFKSANKASKKAFVSLQILLQKLSRKLHNEINHNGKRQIKLKFLKMIIQRYCSEPLKKLRILVLYAFDSIILLDNDFV